MINSNILTFLIAYLFITFSVIGYGLLFERVSTKFNSSKQLGLTGLIGIFFLVLYSYISHYFVSHNILHNTILLIVGFLLFIFFYKNLSEKKYFLILLLLLFVSFISLLIYKTHDDFHYYHFPYSYYLTQYSALIGIGQFNHGFRTPSSIFYLNSLFYLPVVKYFTFYISTTLIFVFSNLILLSKILEKFETKKVSHYAFLCLLFLIFINIFFYRIQEHGTDRSAQILVLIFFLYLISFLKFEINFEKNISTIFILLGLIISLKAFYLLYLLISIPVIFILFKEKKNFLILDILNNKFFWLFFVLLLNVLLVYFINTGCLIYPVSFTCFDSLPWSIGSQEVERMTVHYENWSKAGMTPIFKVENPVEHIQNLNWLSIWIDTYFFTKVSDFIFGLIFIMIVMMTIFYKKKRVNLNINKNIFLIFFLFFLLLLEWFFNHPALRYGGYCLIVILLFYPFSLILEKYDNSLNEKKYKFIFLILVIFSIFFIRNIFRINDEINKYSYKPVTETFYKVENKHFRIDKKFKALIKNFEMCEIGHDSCDSVLRLKVEKIFDKKYIFVVN